MKIFFSVGEPSGDLHGANLIRNLRKDCPDVECVGYGGPKMESAGCELHEDLTQLAVMFIVRALLNIHRFWDLLKRADTYFREERPDAVVLIDYPGFNWWIARKAKANGIPVFYYGAPQLWAWAPWRVKKMRRLVDHVLCKLPFEEKWFRDRGCNAHYVGHPYYDQLAEQVLDQEMVQQYQQAPGPLVTILPGSRRQEVAHTLEPLLRAAEHAREEVPDLRIAIASFNEQQAQTARELVKGIGSDAEVVEGHTQELMVAADCCLACSGSVSLELLYHKKPTVIFYALSWLVFQLGIYLLIRIRYITLVNLLATSKFERGKGEKPDPDSPDAEKVPFPEYVVPLGVDRSPRMARWIVRWLTDDTARQECVAQLADLKARYAAPGASVRSAQYILTELGHEVSQAEAA